MLRKWNPRLGLIVGGLGMGVLLCAVAVKLGATAEHLLFAGIFLGIVA